jgi:hypothetical protein
VFVLADHRLINWYRKKARLLSSSLSSRISGGMTLAPILPPFDSAGEVHYRAENGSLIEAYIEQAARIAEGDFPILSAGSADWRGGDFWRRHPLTGAPLPRSFHPYNMELYSGGDINAATWVASLPFLPALAQAYRYTGDVTYVSRICEAVDSWSGSESPARSTSWDADLAVAMRAVSILYTLSLLPQSALPAESRRKMTRVILLSGSILELIVRKPSFNHWVVNAFGLFCCGLAAREMEAGRRWMRAGASILESQLTQQFFADGVHGERSPGYMRLVVEVYLHYRALGQHHGVGFGADFDRRLHHACHALYRLCDQEGVPTRFGDDSDLNLLSSRTAAEAMALAAVMFRSTELRARANNFPALAFWLLGDKGYREFQSLRCGSETARSFALSDAGYYAAQSTTGALMLTCGAELTRNNGHSHADVFGFELRVKGDRVLVDAGTFAYFPSRQWRDYFRSTRAHNTVVVDGRDQAVPQPHDHFGWRKFPHVHVHAWSTSESHDLFDAEHNGYGELEDPVVHRRRVLYVKPDYWVIIDDLLGRGDHFCELFFQFAPGEVLFEKAERTVARRQWGNLEIRQLAEGCQADIVTGQEQPIRGWISSGYGHKEPAPSLCFSRLGSLPFRFCSVILAVAAGEEVFTRQTGEWIEVRSDRFADRIRIPADVEEDAATTLERRVPVASLQLTRQ